ncbi:ImmA/IrrE family metallo-endopeptidase [Marinococcus luteus]|uniref:ImmA/IrrE family metallo-endopeptidase n=1 Tax=Marinococcus luteus TaxID=1122204 RepID=UPI002ACD18E9|nr:ImmA/IrrE family metallo-endopeptidase [Marinococcus luteus]MDZ5782089.1 ImmA/IrrE family metallo-endopeptidase [Marinococcus luteus]
MRELNKEFHGERLSQARAIRNKTIQELADEVGVTHQAISKYEKNKMRPEREVLDKLVQVLNFETNFFYKEITTGDIYDKPFIFRKRAGTAKKYQNQFIEQVAVISELIETIQSKMYLPEFELNLILQRTEKTSCFLGENEIVNLAKSVRRYLSLGDGPIDNFTLLCEKLGVIVVYLDSDRFLVDGCSTIINGRPYIILNENYTSSVRRRFTLAHELGHILLHSNLSSNVMNKRENEKQFEYEANFFASEILMPEATFVNDLNGIGLDYLLTLKRHWKVSLQAMIFRAEQLDIFTQEYALYLRQQISRKKWRKEEPYDEEIPLEKPVMLSRALKYLVNNEKTTINELSFQSGISPEEILYWFNGESVNDMPKNNNSTNHLKRVK